MGIGRPVGGITPLGTPIKVKVDQGATVYPTLEAAVDDHNAVIQGQDQAVAPMADLATGYIAPPIPGGLQMTGNLIALPAQPVPLPDPTVGPPVPPPPLSKLTDGAGNYLMDGASNNLATP